MQLSFREHFEQQRHAALEDMYRQSVLLSMQIAKEIAERIPFLTESAALDPRAYPPCTIQTFALSSIPVYAFRYPGMLPLYTEEKKFQNELREYYQQATVEAMSSFPQPQPFDKAVMYMCHYFSDLRIRDLDNRNRRHLINAMRRAGIIQDDCWEKLSTMEAGFKDSEKNNYIEVYVTDQSNQLELINFVNNKAEK